MLVQLARGDVNSVFLVQACLRQHEKSIDKNALAVISPLAIKHAQARDEERKRGFIRGPLHGVPIVIKDNILFADGTPTTANSFALKHLIPSQHATLVRSLLDAGAIIFAKANLSEFAYFMGDEKTPSGYGSMYGQVKHPVDETLDPYGSSTGSAVAVALNIVPASIGTETNGSLMAPAHQCQIVAFKPTPGMISREGIIPISPTQDTAGPMAHTVYDCALLMDVLSKEDDQDPLTKQVVRPSSFIETLAHPLPPRRIGILVFPKQPYHPIDIVQMENTKKHLRELGHTLIDVTMDVPELDNYPTLMREFKVALNAFLNEHPHPGMPKSLSEVIYFNQQNADRCLRYGQETLIKSEGMPDTYDETYFQLRSQLLQEASLLETRMIAESLDYVFAPTWLGFAPIYGQPSLCLPMGYVDHRPTAHTFIGRKGHDLELLHFGHTYFDLYLKKSESKG